MTTTVIGMGYVGITYAAILANAGHTVYAIEVDPERLESIRRGKSFSHEGYLDPLLAAGLKSGLLIPTDSYGDAIAKSDIIFSCVGTPDNPDGSINLSYVYTVVDQVSKLVGDGEKIFVQKSTVPVGVGEKLQQLFKDSDTNIQYISNPEFLREGTAVMDTLWFDRVVVGGSEKKATTTLINVYKQITAQRDTIAARAGLTLPSKRKVNADEYIVTSVNSAELIKVTANAFLATKVTFANSIAKLADAAGADIVEVMDAVGADPRIGRAFFNAGRGFGGGCFPKDISGLISSSTDYGVELDILHAVVQENNSMPGYIINKAMNAAPNGSLAGKRVAVLGLSFKAGATDFRRSPSIRIANLLVESAGATVKAYDPVADKSLYAKNDLNDTVTIVKNIEDALTGVDVVFVATDWQEFKSMQADRYAELMSGTLFVDCMNSFSPDIIQSAGLTYIGVGR
jgi:UDPglucose 6-dehydrogenase